MSAHVEFVVWFVIGVFLVLAVYAIWLRRQDRWMDASPWKGYRCSPDQRVDELLAMRHGRPWGSGAPLPPYRRRRIAQIVSIDYSEAGERRLWALADDASVWRLAGRRWQRVELPPLPSRDLDRIADAPAPKEDRA